MEIFIKRLVHTASVNYVSNAKHHQKVIEDNIAILISGSDHVKSTPGELWSKIFHIRVEQDMEDYLANPSSRPAPVTAIRLSQVCRFWRMTAFAERNLWRFIMTYAKTSWSPARNAMLKHICARQSRTPDLIFDPSRQPQRSVWGSFNKIEENAVGLVGSHTLEIIARGNIHIDSTSYPFGKPTSVVLHLFPTTQNPSFDRILSPFAEVQSLEIVSNNGLPSLDPHLPNICPQLTSLKLNLADSQSINLGAYVGQNLTELHIN